MSVPGIPLPIETGRLRIRPLRLDDATAMHRVWSDPEVMRFLPAEPSASLPESRERLERHIGRHEETGLALWAIEERTSAGVVGACGLFLVEGTGPDVEVAYHLARRHWGHGFATEAAAACVSAGLEAGFAEILGFTYPENAASIRVLEKAGLRRDGRAHLYGRELLRFTTAGASPTG